MVTEVQQLFPVKGKTFKELAYLNKPKQIQKMLTLVEVIQVVVRQQL